jgi:hypothetical protein
MESIGQRLRLGRERLGLSLEEAERTTRIRAQHLAALERNDFDSLPSPVQARGFLKNYSDFLKLDTVRVLQDYSGTVPSRPQTGGRPPVGPEVRVRRRGWLSTDLLVAATIALGTLALLVWGGGRAMASLRAASASAGESSAFLLPTATLATSLSAEILAEAAPAAIEIISASPTLPPLNLPSGRISVRLLVVQRAWVRALADGQVRYQGRVEPGAILDLSGDQVVEVTTGNGAAFHLALNGTDLGLLGGLDEVVIRLWTSEGEITPTPTITPTTTQTPRPSATLREAATPTGAGG